MRRPFHKIDSSGHMVGFEESVVDVLTYLILRDHTLDIIYWPVV